MCIPVANVYTYTLECVAVVSNLRPDEGRPWPGELLPMSCPGGISTKMIRTGLHAMLAMALGGICVQNVLPLNPFGGGESSVAWRGVVPDWWLCSTERSGPANIFFKSLRQRWKEAACLKKRFFNSNMTVINDKGNVASTSRQLPHNLLVGQKDARIRGCCYRAHMFLHV